MALRVGVVIDPWDYPYNGTVVSTRRFVNALSERIEFRLLATPHPEMAQDQRLFPFPKLTIPGVNGIIEGMRVPLANPWGKADVAASLQGLDLVHMQFPFFLGAKVCREAKKLGIPLICSFHVQPENLLRNLGLKSPLLSRLLYKIFIWGLYRHADLVLTPSEFAAQQLRDHGLRQPIEVLSNGVPEKFFELQKCPHGSEKFSILSVGRMAPEKHQELIFQAVTRSKHKNNIQLRLIGTGPLEEKLRTLADSMDIHVELGTATDDELSSAYASADLFVHAGEVELEGMSVLEAMAAGNAVLVSDSDNSASVEFVRDKNALFSSLSASDLAMKIDYWIESDQERRRAGEANRQVAKARHHETSVHQLREIYRRFHGRGADK